MYSEFVYVLRSGPYFKIGKTTELGKRISQLKIQLPFEVELFKVINTNDCTKLETFFHKAYSNLRVNGEWFTLSPHDAALLLLFPSTVDVNNGQQIREAREESLDAIAEVIQQRATEKALEREIEEIASQVQNEVPDSWGNLPFSEMLAAECPYPLGRDDLEWLVAEDDSKE